MDVSIAICTRDRATSLARTLDSFTKMSIPSDLKWELIVVNNGSMDETEAVIGHFQDSLPLHREFEGAPGVSNARNRAVEVAQGAYVIWTDDDVIVDQHWLGSYVDAFRKWPNAAFFGGKIIPLFEGGTPHWLRECWKVVGDAYAFRDLGDEPIHFALKDNRIPYGANFAVRSVEQKAYSYNPALGPGAWIPGEETDVIERMLKDGKSGYWVPGASVEHCTSRARQTITYLANYYQRQGRAQAHQDRNTYLYDGARLFGAPRWLFRRMIMNYCKYRLNRFTSPPSTWIKFFVKFAMDRGRVDYFRRQNELKLCDPTNCGKSHRSEIRQALEHNQRSSRRDDI